MRIRTEASDNPITEMKNHAFGDVKTFLRDRGYKKSRHKITINGCQSSAAWVKRSGGVELMIYGLKLCHDHWEFVLCFNGRPALVDPGMALEIRFSFSGQNQLVKSLEKFERATATLLNTGVEV